jgi:hypothetical protein
MHKFNYKANFQFTRLIKFLRVAFRVRIHATIRLTFRSSDSSSSSPKPKTKKTIKPVLKKPLNSKPATSRAPSKTLSPPISKSKPDLKKRKLSDTKYTHYSSSNNPVEYPAELIHRPKSTARENTSPELKKILKSILVLHPTSIMPGNQITEHRHIEI